MPYLGVCKVIIKLQVNWGDFLYTFIVHKFHSHHNETSDTLIHPQVTFFFNFQFSLIQFAFITPQIWGIYEQSKLGVHTTDS